MPVPPRSPSFPQVLSQAIHRTLDDDVHTHIPARVERYDAAKQLVDVQPMVKKLERQEDGTLKPTSFSIIPGVPLQFPGGGGFRSTYPIQKGDFVTLHFAERSIDAWKSNGGEVNPGDLRTFHISDPIATPGLKPFSAPWTGASTSAATFGKDGGPQLVSRAATLELGGDEAASLTESAVLGNKQKTDLNSMLQSGSQACTSAATACTTAATLMTTVGTAVTAAAGAMSTPPLTPVGAILGTLATALTALGGQLTNLGAQLTALGTAFTTLKTALPNHLSGIVKVK